MMHEIPKHNHNDARKSWQVSLVMLAKVGDPRYLKIKIFYNL